MDTRNSLYTENLLKHVDGIQTLSPLDIARVLFLYMRIVVNNDAVISTVSIATIDSYDGKSVYKRFKRFFDQMYDMFLRNGIDDYGRKVIFKRLTKRKYIVVPSTIKEMETINRIVIEETHKYLKLRKSYDLRRNLMEKFRFAIKKYLHLTYTLGFNEPSLCAKTLAREHKIDKYILSGDFPIILLPFLPDIEREICSNYEHYAMKDAWEMMKGRYFNHRREYSVLAVEIKALFLKNIPNFSEYFDRIYSDTYYKLMLGKRNEDRQAKNGKVPNIHRPSHRYLKRQGIPSEDS